MPTAYVLINCDLGSEESLIQELREIEGVNEAHGVYGVYDILAKVEAQTEDKIKEIVTLKIRRLKKASSTKTLWTIEGKE